MLDRKPSLEVRQRVEQLLMKLDPRRFPELLRTLRAVQVLESIATPDACALLRRVAQGAPDARLTQEARAAVVRLDTGP